MLHTIFLVPITCSLEGTGTLWMPHSMSMMYDLRRLRGPYSNVMCPRSAAIEDGRSLDKQALQSLRVLLAGDPGRDSLTHNLTQGADFQGNLVRCFRSREMQPEMVQLQAQNISMLQQAPWPGCVHRGEAGSAGSMEVQL